MKFKQYEFSDIAEYITTKIDITSIEQDKYISTDNMLANFGGVSIADSLPATERCNSFKKRDILFSNIRTYFKKVWFAGFDGGCSADVLVIRSKNEEIVLNEFLYLLICSEEFINFTIASSNGAKMPRGDKNAIKKYVFNIPNIEYQKQCIAQYFNLNKKIQLNTQINQTLEQIAQTIFKSWFIAFDPVHAKANALASGQTLEQATQAAMAVISGKNTQELHRLQTANPEQYQQLWEIAEAFPSGFDEEGVPRGWESKKVGEVVETVGGATPSTKNEDFWLDGDISWTTPKDLSSLKSKVLLKTERKITQQGLRKISSGLLDIDTVLMSSRAPVGYLALVKTPVAINQGYIAIKKQDLLNPYYMLFWCVFNMEEIKNRSSGTTFAEISKSSFREIPIIVPSRRIVDYFRDKVSSLYDLITKNEQEVNLLGNIRDELLPKLLSGDISNE